MMLLANRAGYPFLGNDFFREIGDVFSSHVISNPDRASEIQLLRSYAPSVDLDVVERLTLAFEQVGSRTRDPRCVLTPAHSCESSWTAGSWPTRTVLGRKGGGALVRLTTRATESAWRW